MTFTRKILGLLILALFVFTSCSNEKEYYMFTSFHEPATDGLRFLYSADGLHWDSIPGIWLEPSIGSQRVMRDPSIARGKDGIYHLVWTTSWKGDLGFGYAQSKDLIHWTEPRMINVMAHEPTTVNVWAPELFFDEDKNQFMVVWASCIPYRFEKGIEDEYNNHRLYYITTPDFETISETKLLFDPGFSSIDATIVKRDEKDFVMVYKDNTRPQRNLMVAFANAPEGPYTSDCAAFTDSFIEGPNMLKIDKNYYIFYDEYRKYRYGAIKTKDFKSFVDANAEISFPKGHKHGTIFRAPASVVTKMLEQKSK